MFITIIGFLGFLTDWKSIPKVLFNLIFEGWFWTSLME